MNLGKESEYIEFKKSTAQLPRALESICAMLNKHGKGKIYFGVLDDGEVCGFDLGNKTMKDISSQIAEKIKPQIVPTITFEMYDDKEIICVSFAGDQKPYCVSGTYYIRSGCENKKLEPEELKDLIFTNSIEMISEMESRNQELTFHQLKSLYLDKGIRFEDTTLLNNLGLYTKNKKYNYLAELLSDNNDLSIKVVRFSGVDKSNMLSRNEYGYKNLFLAMEQALNYAISFNETKVELGGQLERKEIKLFEENCLREAWVNACLHNKWSKNIPPAIYIFDDRIEIVSTGGLPIDFSLDEFYAGISRPINKQLQKIMGQLGYVEQTGHGVPEIIKNYGKEAFDIGDNHITVIIKFKFDPSNRTIIDEGLSSTEKSVLEMIKIYPSKTKKELANVLKLSESRISEIINILKSRNLIARCGANKNGYWIVK